MSDFAFAFAAGFSLGLAITGAAILYYRSELNDLRAADDTDSWRPYLQPGDVVLAKDRRGVVFQLTVGVNGISITSAGTACLHVESDNPVFLSDVVTLVRKAGEGADA